jgi:hypothetical protein
MGFRSLKNKETLIVIYKINRFICLKIYLINRNGASAHSDIGSIIIRGLQRIPFSINKMKSIKIDQVWSPDVEPNTVRWKAYIHRFQWCLANLLFGLGTSKLYCPLLFLL